MKVKVTALVSALLIVLAGLLAGGTAHAATAASGMPALGWNSWYAFGAGLSESRILQQASELNSTGLAAAGYDTVTLDDGWQAGTAPRAAGRPLTWNTALFPHGIPWLASQLHAEGLKLGIYTAIGNRTCLNHPGSYGAYTADAATFRSWGVDFVKVDSCKGLPSWTTSATLTASFAQFGGDIRDAGMAYSQELPVLMPVGSPPYMAAVRASSQWSNMWRVAPDEHWTDSAGYTIDGHLADDIHLHGSAGPGHWNDLDMIVGANKSGSAHPFNWSLAQQQAQLSVWSMEASPLFVSADLGSMTAAELAALKNPDMIAIDQSGSQASHGALVNSLQALSKPADGGTAVLIANTTTHTHSAVFTAAQLGIPATAAYLNVWNGRNGKTRGAYVNLAPGTAVLIVVK